MKMKLPVPVDVHTVSIWVWASPTTNMLCTAKTHITWEPCLFPEIVAPISSIEMKPQWIVRHLKDTNKEQNTLASSSIHWGGDLVKEDTPI